ncbi:MAG: fold hydrolase [Clostridia bacterium]|jgi:beta-lactamase superfamily II metal-dependent hydrolase|nr:fold hydrolase [Clostridia bacterium]
MKTKHTALLTRLWILVVIIGITLNSGCAPKQEAGMTSEIHFIDTGNSDAILIIQGENAALIDGGDNDDEHLISDYIKGQGIKELQYLFATHPDADHIGGLDGVINTINVKQVYIGNGQAETKTYRDFVEALMEHKITPSVPLVNSDFVMGSGSFKVLSAAHAKDVNNTSLVLLYTNGKDRVLFMGDAGDEIEQTLDCGKVDLIKIGHHGSSSSSEKDFLMRSRPQYAVITVGKDNKYGHPHKETMQVLSQLDIPVYRTDESGNIVFISTGNGISTNGDADSYNTGGSDDLETSDKIPDTSSKGKKVFFTTNSKKYHKISSCSGMKKPIEGTILQAGNRTACDKCYE